MRGQGGIALILAGRTAVSLEGLKRDIGGAVEVVVLDRDRAGADDLRAVAAKVVIDAAGPFQDSRTTLIEAAIAARCHYLDLDDFAADFARHGITTQTETQPVPPM